MVEDGDQLDVEGGTALEPAEFGTEIYDRIENASVPVDRIHLHPRPSLEVDNLKTPSAGLVVTALVLDGIAVGLSYAALHPATEIDTVSALLATLIVVGIIVLGATILSYMIAARFLNTTVVRLRDGALRAAPGPLPVPFGSHVTVDDIEDMSWNRGSDESWELVAVRKDGSEEQLVAFLPDERTARITAKVVQSWLAPSGDRSHVVEW